MESGHFLINFMILDEPEFDSPEDDALLGYGRCGVCIVINTHTEKERK